MASSMGKVGKQTLAEAVVQRKVGEASGDGSTEARTGSAGSSNGVAETGARRPGGGQALPDATRGKMESFFGRDFSGVRVHEGQQAGALGALAYTEGTNLHFAPGQYQPDSLSGQELIGHELAHVVQQSEGRVSATTQAKGVALNDSPALEAEADSLGARAARHEGSAAGAMGARGAGGGRGTKMESWAAGDVYSALGLGGDCPSCGKESVGGECAECQRSEASGVVQRQVAPGGGACHGTNRRAGAQHEAIQAHYIGGIDPTGIREYAIPGGSGSGAVGYADLVSMGSGAIYEIKPYFPTEIGTGLAQVAGYVVGARANCNRSIPWHTGFAYPDSVIPFGSGQIVAKQYGNPGLILYYVRQRPRLQEAPSRQRVVDVLLALGLSLALVAVVAAALLDPEPASKLALAGLSVFMIGVILERFGLKDPDVPVEA